MQREHWEKERWRRRELLIREREEAAWLDRVKGESHQAASTLITMGKVVKAS